MGRVDTMTLRRSALAWWDDQIRAAITTHGTQTEPNRAGLPPTPTTQEPCTTPPAPAGPAPAAATTSHTGRPRSGANTGPRVDAHFRCPR
jgi:hypothetical protein